MARKTVLFEFHEQSKGRMVEFSGWELPVQFKGPLAEHEQCRKEAALFDTSHMGIFYIVGANAPEALGRACTQNAPALSVGRCRYGFILQENGGVLDDTILFRLNETAFYLVVNAGPREKDLATLQERLGGAAELRDLTEEGWAKVDVQGPKAYEALAPLGFPDLGHLSYFQGAAFEWEGQSLLITRTGYTGELGYEVLGPGEIIAPLYGRLLESDQTEPAGLAARDSLRLEMGLPLYGHELSEKLNPVEAGLEQFAQTNHEYIGVEVVRRALEKGPERRLVLFEGESRRRPQPENALYAEGREVGLVTSGAFSPSLKKGIGMGFVQTPWAEPGKTLEVGTGGKRQGAVVRKKPLYQKATARKNPLSE